MTERIYILLPVHNRCKITRCFIECLKLQTYHNYHLLLIDDGSTDGTEEMVRERITPEKFTVIKGKGNWWWAGSLQQGINWLKRKPLRPSDVVLIINDDINYGPDFLKNGINFLKRFPNALLLARFYDVERGKVVESGVHADFRHLNFTVAGSSKDINCLSTRGLFMTWEVFEKIGGFYPVILPHYGSDYEFTLRARRKGYSLMTDSEVYVVPDLTKTGIRKFKENKFRDEVSMLFSKKCTMNPVYWTSFILLASPARWVPLNLAKVWGRAIWRILKSIRKSFVPWA